MAWYSVFGNLVNSSTSEVFDVASSSGDLGVNVGVNLADSFHGAAAGNSAVDRSRGLVVVVETEVGTNAQVGVSAFDGGGSDKASRTALAGVVVGVLEREEVSVVEAGLAAEGGVWKEATVVESDLLSGSAGSVRSGSESAEGGTVFNNNTSNIDVDIAVLANLDAISLLSNVSDDSQILSASGSDDGGTGSNDERVAVGNLVVHDGVCGLGLVVVGGVNGGRKLGLATESNVGIFIEGKGAIVSHIGGKSVINFSISWDSIEIDTDINDVDLTTSQVE